MQDSRGNKHMARSHSMSKHLRSDESGIALMTVLLVSMLACALMAGVFAAIALRPAFVGS